MGWNCYTKYMKVIANPNNYVLVLERGEELVTSLDQFAREQNLDSAWVSGLGGASDVTISWYDIKTKQYVDRAITDALEILSLTGNLSTVDGKPFWHLHGTFAGRDYAAFGGHVKQLVVGLTCELHVTPLETSMTRRHDEETGLKLLGAT